MGQQPFFGFTERRKASKSLAWNSGPKARVADSSTTQRRQSVLEHRDCKLDFSAALKFQFRNDWTKLQNFFIFWNAAFTTGKVRTTKCTTTNCAAISGYSTFLRAQYNLAAVRTSEICSLHGCAEFIENKCTFIDKIASVFFTLQIVLI